RFSPTLQICGPTHGPCSLSLTAMCPVGRSGLHQPTQHGYHWPDPWTGGDPHREKMCALGVAAMAHGYTLDNAWVHARERLGRLEAHFDPGSIRHLERL